MRFTVLLFLSILFIDSSYSQENNITSTEEILKKALEAKENKVYEEAIRLGNKAIHIYGQSRNTLSDTILANAYSIIGGASLNAGEYINALKSFEKALDMRKKLLGENSPSNFKLYGNLGAIYRRIGKYDKALDNLERALTIGLTKHGEDSRPLAPVFYQIGVLYAYKAQLEEAVAYFKKALGIYQKIKDQPKIASLYNALGISYQELKRYEEALQYLEKALKIKEAAQNKNYPNIADAYNNIGLVFSSKKNHSEALHYYKKAKEIWFNHFGYRNPNIALPLDNIGASYAFLKDFDKALQNSLLALEIRKKAFGSKGPDIAQSCNNLGEIYKFMGDEKNAFSYYLQAINATGFDWRDQNIDELEFNRDILLSISNIARLRSKIEVDTIPNQRQLVNLMYDISNHFNKNIQSESSRIMFKDEVYTIYEASISIAQSWTPRDRTEEFTFAERGKSTVLLSEVRNSYIKAYKGLPESIRNKDSELRSKITSNQNKLRQEEEKGEEKDVEAIKEYNNQIFSLKTEQEAFLTLLKEKYPDFYQLKYDNTVATVEEIQSLLTKDQALIEYFVGDSIIYTFVITPSDFNVVNIKRNFPLDDWVKQVRNGIYAQRLKQKEKCGNIDCDELYVNAAYQLYEKIIQPLPSLPKRLIIVADGILNYLPFDALLMSKPQELRAFRKHEYMLKKHAISYNYSATLYQQVCAKQYTENRKPFLGIAPDFDDTENAEPDTAQLALKSALTPLCCNQDEVRYIQKLWGGDTLMANEVSLDTFKHIAKNYRIIHLSTHGKAFDKTGDYSYLAFSKYHNSSEHQKLFGSDLYNLELNADMIVLSACETGIGELKRGEGIIGLTRGFLYAGTKSIITSLWSVQEDGTKQLLEYFYDNLKAGMPKDIAMQQAKLSMVQQNRYAHPFLWAGFTPIGDMEVLDLGGRNYWWYFLIGGSVFMLLLFFYRGSVNS